MQERQGGGGYAHTAGGYTSAPSSARPTGLVSSPEARPFPAAAQAGTVTAPSTRSGFESATQATSAVELYDDIRRGIDRLRRDLRAAAGRA